MTRPSVTIGIPAFNEENNIACLLGDLLKQHRSNFTLNKIIVASDGSTDNTISLARSVKIKQLVVLANKYRKGVAARQNQIISHTNSDILVLLNADIRIFDPDYINLLIQPITEGRADLTSSALKELPARTFAETAFNTAMKLKTVLFETWKDGHNGYSCHGAARAFGKNLYSKLSFTDDVGEDMYSYLECLRLGKVFQYVRKTAVWYRNPSNISDQLKQSTRFVKFHANFLAMEKYRSFIEELKIPITVYMLAAFKSLPIIILNPVQTLAYLLITLYIRYRILFKPYQKDLWITNSTKSIS